MCTCTRRDGEGGRRFQGSGLPGVGPAWASRGWRPVGQGSFLGAQVSGLEEMLTWTEGFLPDPPRDSPGVAFSPDGCACATQERGALPWKDVWGAVLP